MAVDWRASLWRQYGAAIDMLDDAVRLCPEHLWTVVLWEDSEDARYGQFWFLAAHTLIWLDIFLTGSEEGFVPPPPFKRGALPDAPYARAHIQAYLGTCRSKCQATIEQMTDEQAQQRCGIAWLDISVLELQLYSMRHVQEHATQLNLVLGQHAIPGPDWVPRARHEPDSEAQT